MGENYPYLFNLTLNIFQQTFRSQHLRFNRLTKRITHDFSRGSQQTQNINLYNICTTSAQRLRRWTNIVQMLYKMFCVCWVSGLMIKQNIVADQG